MKIKTLFIFIVLIIQGCQRRNEEKITLIISDLKEIQNLNTDERKKKFLINIIHKDQDIRSQYDSVVIKYGYNSLKYKEHIEDMKKIDKINLLKIEYYLKLYGHPTLKKHGENAVYCPWLIIHHSSEIEVRKKYFNILENAYTSGNLEKSLFLLYLQRFYSLKYGKEYKVRDFNNEITEIIKALDV